MPWAKRTSPVLGYQLAKGQETLEGGNKETVICLDGDKLALGCPKGLTESMCFNLFISDLNLGESSEVVTFVDDTNRLQRAPKGSLRARGMGHTMADKVQYRQV